MGIDRNGLKFLLKSKEAGADFSSMITLGRQFLYLDVPSFETIAAHFSKSLPAGFTEKLFKEQYADSLYKQLLDAKTTDSVDASAYEGATIVHDFNAPVPEELKNKYTLVFDGGSLEHIFNFPTALKNCMEMLKLNGHFISVCPANNFCGHGFYQFSPELWHRVFSPENGFALDCLLVYLDMNETKWFRIKDPKQLKKRLTLINNKPTYLAIRAKKINSLIPFASGFPQQSDYSSVWDNYDQSGKQNGLTFPDKRKHSLMVTLKSKIKGLVCKDNIRQPGDISRDFIEEFEM